MDVEKAIWINAIVPAISRWRIYLSFLDFSASTRLASSSSWPQRRSSADGEVGVEEGHLGQDANGVVERVRFLEQVGDYEIGRDGGRGWAQMVLDQPPSQQLRTFSWTAFQGKSSLRR